MALVDDLIAARALIDTPEKWGKGDYWSLDRTCFCATGAVIEAVRTGGVSYNCVPQMTALHCALPPKYRVTDIIFDVAVFNDAYATTHADVMALFDRAIAKARSPSTPS